MKKSDVGIVAVIYAVCLLFFVMTIKLPTEAQTYPLCLVAALFVLNTLYIGRAWLCYRRDRNIIDDIGEGFAAFLPGQFFCAIFLGLFYMVLLWLVGFYVSTILYMVSTMLFLRVPKPHIVITCGVMIALIYLVFTLFLKVPLPVGLLFR